MTTLETLRPVVPTIGVHPRIASAEYHQWRALSHTWLNHLRKSPAHLIAHLREDSAADTPALRLGRAVHTAILEPDLFASEYVEAPELDRRTKEGKAAWAVFMESHVAGNILTVEEYRQCAAMKEAVWSRRSAKTLLGAEGDAELSVVWDNDGILCKARADRMSWKLKGGTIVDLKTCQDASPTEFEKTIFKFGYHRQAAFYLQGFGAHKVAAKHFCIVAVEKEPPYEVGVYRLTEEAIDAGWKSIEPIIDVYRRCIETDIWGGYADEILDIALPAWGWNQV